MNIPKKTNGYLSYIWLTLGCILTLFVGMRWNVPVVAWLAPVFLIRFFRSQGKWYKTLIAVPLLVLMAFIKFHGGWDLSIVGEIGLGFVLIIPMLVALYLDRAFARRDGILATLVYPSVYTALEYLICLTPLGASLSIAVTQFDSLPLIQLASVTGIWGISFIISWFASAMNVLWKNGFAVKKALAPALAFTAIFVLVLSYGGLRLVVLRPEEETVRVGGVSVVQPTDYWSEIIDKGTPADIAHQYDAEFELLEESLFSESERVVQMGTQIVFWSEANVVLHPDKEAVFLERAQAFAREHDIYFVPALLVFKYGEMYADNKLVMITPNGEIAYEYEKTMSWYETDSDGVLRVLDTPYGRIATAICFDMDFPQFIHQAARQDVDIMLVPAFDWEPIKTFHTQVGLFRGIENGFSVIRQVNKGTSMATDYLGRVIAYQDFFTTTNRIMVVDVPIEGVETVYGALGDWTAYITVLFMVGMIAWRIFRYYTRSSSLRANL